MNGNGERYFAAYPSAPEMISGSIEAAEKVNSSSVQFNTWRSTFGPGRIIDQSVLPYIENSLGLICDVTYPNNNVYFEIGYALGLGKPIVPIVNTSCRDAGGYLRRLGLMDNVGQIRYENHEDLIYKLDEFNPAPLIAIGNPPISSQPLLVLDSLRRNEVSTHLISAVKNKVKLYRSVDPQEEYRLSVRTAWDLVSESAAIVVTLFGDNREDYLLHNIRASFLAGIAIAKGIEVRILTDPDVMPPLDFIDICRTVKSEAHIDDVIDDLVQYVVGARRKRPRSVANLSGLAEISFGASAAENEMRDLSEYFVETHEYQSALAGRGRIVVGRKGAGKTAIFWRVRDVARAKHRNEVVVDLKPDGYQLRKFKADFVEMLQGGTKDHTLTAFWEYLILGEIIRKIFDDDHKRFYGRDANVTRKLDRLASTRDRVFEGREGDFSERMRALMSHIKKRYSDSFAAETSAYLSNDAVTEIIHATGIGDLNRAVVDYIDNKERVLVLLDNVDKGWGAQGVDEDDVLIVTCLIDALRKIERAFDRSARKLDWLLFLRSDVYENLVENQNDRGKDGVIRVDWDKPAALEQVITSRLECMEASRFPSGTSWDEICVPTISGESSLSWLVARCLMRPRYLIQLCDACISQAAASGLDRIDESSLIRGYENFSHDLLGHTAFEIRDINPNAEDLVYCLIGMRYRSSISEIRCAISSQMPSIDADEAIRLLFWFGVLGIEAPGGEEKYIYNFRYDMKLLMQTLRAVGEESATIFVNVAFRKGLQCVDLI